MSNSQNNITDGSVVFENKPTLDIDNYTSSQEVELTPNSFTRQNNQKVAITLNLLFLLP